MEKLIELLNEYEKDGLNEFETYVERWYCERTKQILSGKWENNNELKPCEIIGKRYGFIDWLVKNDKIDLDKVEQEAMSWFDDESPVYGKNIRTARLIMMLSVSNNPISDLVYYLKE